jgi:hypothetical protein
LGEILYWGTLLPELVEKEELIISALTEFLANRLQPRPVVDEGCASDRHVMLSSRVTGSLSREMLRAARRLRCCGGARCAVAATTHQPCNVKGCGCASVETNQAHALVRGPRRGAISHGSKTRPKAFVEAASLSCQFEVERRDGERFCENTEFLGSVLQRWGQMGQGMDRREAAKGEWSRFHRAAAPDEVLGAHIVDKDLLPSAVRSQNDPRVRRGRIPLEIHG